MYQNDKAELEMKRVLSAGGMLNHKVIECEVIRYDEREECIYLLLENEEVTSVSLDAVYECRIEHGEETVLSQGRIIERYWHENGKIIIYQIENGFYKNSIKSVDKREVE